MRRTLFLLLCFCLEVQQPFSCYYTTAYLVHVI